MSQRYKGMVPLGIALWAVSMAPSGSLAALQGSDDFSSLTIDPNRWGENEGFGAAGTLGAFWHQDERVNYATGGLFVQGQQTPTDDDAVFRPWILNAANYDENWSAQVEVETNTKQDFQFIRASSAMHEGLAVLDKQGDPMGNVAFISLSRVIESDGKSAGQWTFDGRIADDSMASAETATEALSGAVKVSWNAAGRKLSGWFQETGGETELIGEMTVDSGGDLDWGMGTGDTFKVGLFARSSGVVSASPPTPWQGNMLAS